MLSSKYAKAALIGFVVTMAFGFFGEIHQFAKHCDEIRGKVLRLHVMANSDTPQDQALKLMVRDAILKESGEIFYKINTKQQAMQRVQSELVAIQSLAQQALKTQGSSYRVQVEIVNMFFDNRVYDTMELPAGRYDAVRITIGQGNGKNWWCVLYPTLCLPTAEGESPPDLVQTLGEEAANIVEQPAQYQVKFALIEWFEKIKNDATSQA